jgi:uncharacterized membrane protein
VTRSPKKVLTYPQHVI